MGDWLDELSEDPAPVDRSRARRRLLVVGAVAATVVAAAITTGLLITPDLPECVPPTPEQAREQAEDAPPGMESLVALATGGICGAR